MAEGSKSHDRRYGARKTDEGTSLLDKHNTADEEVNVSSYQLFTEGAPQDSRRLLSNNIAVLQQHDSSSERFNIDAEHEMKALDGVDCTGELRVVEVLLVVLSCLEHNLPTLLAVLLVCKQWRYYACYMRQWSTFKHAALDGYTDRLSRHQFRHQALNGRVSQQFRSINVDVSFARYVRSTTKHLDAFMMVMQRWDYVERRGIVAPRSSLFGCCQNKGVCLEVACCFPCLYEQFFPACETMSLFGERQYALPENSRVTKYSALTFVCLVIPCFPFVHPSLVWQTRRVYGLEAGESVCAPMFCTPCYMCRIYRDFGWTEQRLVEHVGSERDSGGQHHEFRFSRPQLMHASVEQPHVMT